MLTTGPAKRLVVHVGEIAGSGLVAISDVDVILYRSTAEKKA